MMRICYRVHSIYHFKLFYQSFKNKRQDKKKKLAIDHNDYNRQMNFEKTNEFPAITWVFKVFCTRTHIGR